MKDLKIIGIIREKILFRNSFCEIKEKKSLKKAPRFAWISKNVQELLMVKAGVFYLLFFENLDKDLKLNLNCFYCGFFQKVRLFLTSIEFLNLL